MTYTGTRSVLDADSHLMETADWLASYTAPEFRADVPPLPYQDDPDFASRLATVEPNLQLRNSDRRARTAADGAIMSMATKGIEAVGATDARERSHALDVLGFGAQLVFPTFSFVQVMMAETPELRLETMLAMNRGLAEFCADDSRLLATAHIPFDLGPAVALRVLREAIDAGAVAPTVDMVPRRGAHSMTHPEFDVVWAAIVDADMPAMVHVGLDNGLRPVRREYFDNGRTLAHFRSDAPGDALSYMAIGYPAELFLAAMVFDGILHRFPTLRLGVTELGASWVPSFLQTLDQAHRAFRRLQDLSHLTGPPSDVIRRHARFTPFAGEDVGWLHETEDADLFMFSSDYPHHEGSDDPIGRFERTMTGVSDERQARFYSDTFGELMGSHLVR